MHTRPARHILSRVAILVRDTQMRVATVEHRKPVRTPSDMYLLSMLILFPYSDSARWHSVDDAAAKAGTVLSAKITRPKLKMHTLIEACVFQDSICIAYAFVTLAYICFFLLKISNGNKNIARKQFPFEAFSQQIYSMIITYINSEFSLWIVRRSNLIMECELISIAFVTAKYAGRNENVNFTSRRRRLHLSSAAAKMQIIRISHYAY